MKRHFNNLSRSCTKQSKKCFTSAINIFLGFVVLVLGVVYLVGMNNLTVQGFTLKELKSKASMLAEENADLHTKVLNLQSYSAISPRLNNLNMVAVDEIVYLNSESAVMAKK